MENLIKVGDGGRESSYGKVGRHAESAGSLKLQILKEKRDVMVGSIRAVSVLLMRKRAVLQLLCQVLGVED